MRADPLLAEELNTFYGRFECNGGATLPICAPGSSRQSSDVYAITFSEHDVRRELKRVNVRKAAGPHGITGRVLRSCADQLAGLFTSIFNESLATSVVPTSFKKSVIIPVPKNSKPSCLNDYRPVALTSTVMKVFERLLKKHIWSSIPTTLDPLQFAYRPNRSTDDAISQVLHSSLTHIDSKNGNYVRLLFIDYSSAFNTIVPTKLAVKLSDLGLNTSLDSRYPHRQTTSGESRPVHLQLHNPERRSPTGLCTEPPAILSIHPRLCVLSQLHFYCQICWWYCGPGPRFQQWWGRILAWGGETHIMVPGQLPLSECEQNQRADCGLQEETAASLHSSYDQWDPCGEGEQLQVPRCKHLRGPDHWTTHIQTQVKKARQRLYHLRQAEEIQGLTSYPENFLFRGHRKCYWLSASQCGIIMPQTRTAKLCRESCA